MASSPIVVLLSAHPTDQARGMALVHRIVSSISTLGIVHHVVFGGEKWVLDLPHRLLRADRELEVLPGDAVPVLVDHHHREKHASRMK